ncbi:hypothetical protein diail_4424 [Diaporthe ilicicola]|nr:hypothetical protein diail_4424 [Diaporthe ilicicola]
MTKSVHPLAHKLSIANGLLDMLKKENHELHLEVLRLQTHKRARPAANRPTVSSHSHNGTSEQPIPSFARQTKSSSLRSSRSSTPSPTSSSPDSDRSPIASRPNKIRVNGKPYAYNDGNLKEIRFGYLKPTNASICRSQRPRDPPSWECSTDSSGTSDWAAIVEHPDSPSAVDESESTSHSEMSDVDDREAIAARTRLQDHDWARGPAHNVYINHDVLYDIMSSAERLAKRCLWEWVRVHRPDDIWTIGYLSDLDLGRQVLSSWLDRLPRGFFTHRQTYSYEVISRVNDLVPLRNFLHHFNGEACSLRSMDDHLETVQKLAVLLYDEDSASHARALRDKLRREAERTVAEIETLMMLTALPEAGEPWQHHHAALLWDVAGAIKRHEWVAEEPGRWDQGGGRSPGDSFPRVALSAAREWLMKPSGWDYGISHPAAKEYPDEAGIQAED